MMKLWIARDKDGELYLYNERPVREDSRYEKGIFCSGYFYGEYPSIRLDKDEFPSVTWENSPQQVELISSEEYKHLKECEEICKTESDYGNKHYC